MRVCGRVRQPQQGPWRPGLVCEGLEQACKPAGLALFGTFVRGPTNVCGPQGLAAPMPDPMPTPTPIHIHTRRTCHAPRLAWRPRPRGRHSPGSPGPPAPALPKVNAAGHTGQNPRFTQTYRLPPPPPVHPVPLFQTSLQSPSTAPADRRLVPDPDEVGPNNQRGEATRSKNT